MIVKNETDNCKENIYSFHNPVSAEIIYPGIRTDLGGRDITVRSLQNWMTSVKFLNLSGVCKMGKK